MSRQILYPVACLSCEHASLQRRLATSMYGCFSSGCVCWCQQARCDACARAWVRVLLQWTGSCASSSTWQCGNRLAASCVPDGCACALAANACWTFQGRL